MPRFGLIKKRIALYLIDVHANIVGNIISHLGLTSDLLEVFAPCKKVLNLSSKVSKTFRIKLPFLVGGVGTIGAGLEALNERATGGVDLTERIALICGTSSCHMAVSMSAAWFTHMPDRKSRSERGKCLKF